MDVSWNGFAYEGSLAVGEILKANTYLRELDVSHNGIGWQAARLIARGLTNNDTLEELRVGQNDGDDDDDRRDDHGCCHDDDYDYVVCVLMGGGDNIYGKHAVAVFTISVIFAVFAGLYNFPLLKPSQQLW